MIFLLKSLTIKALNLSQNERMCIDDALTTVDKDDNFPCQDGDFVIKMV